MKRILFLASILSLSTIVFAQQPTISRDHNGSKVIVGFINKNDLATDTAFTWFNTNQKSSTPDANTVAQLKANKDSISIIAFGGTWCDDTKQILPQFYAAANAAGFPDEKITLLGVDRNKKSVQHLSEAFNITNVPTFIVMKNGREIGRVVEYGKSGYPVKEIGLLLGYTKAK